MPNRDPLRSWIGAALIAASMCFLGFVAYQTYSAYRLVGSIGQGPPKVELEANFLWILLLILVPLVAGLIVLRFSRQRK